MGKTDLDITDEILKIVDKIKINLKLIKCQIYLQKKI